MTDHTDLTLPFSALVYSAEGQAHAALEGADHTIVAGLLQRVITDHAASLTGGQAVTLVSVSIDMTGDVPDDADVHFAPNVDRKTRTLIFINGEATHSGGPIIKATAVYRIT